MTDDHTTLVPPVEPLSDVAWARVERGLWTRLDAAEPAPLPDEGPSRRRWLWVAAPLVAALAIVYLVSSRSSVDERTPETADVRVVAPPNAPTTATFDDAHIELAPASAVVMRRDRPTTVLERGGAWFSVAPRVDRPAFTVLAGDTTVRVLGTRFQVSRTDERVTVEVDHGRVEVQYRDRIQLLGAKQRWSSDAPERVDLVIQTAVVEPAPVPVPEPAPDAPTAPAPAPKPRPTVEPPPQPPVVPVPVPVPVPVDDDQTTFEQLSVLEKRDPQTALAGYLKLAQRRTKWSANALYAAARLAADRRDPLAATLLEGYLKRYPAGANAADARALLARLKP